MPSAVEFAIPALLFVLTIWLVFQAILITIDIQKTSVSVQEKISVILPLWLPTTLLGILTLVSFILLLVIS